MKTSWLSLLTGFALAASVCAEGFDDMQEIYSLGLAGVIEDRDLDHATGYSLDDALEVTKRDDAEHDLEQSLVERALEAHPHAHGHGVSKRGKKKKKTSSHKKSSTSGGFSSTITWYSGHDLLYPSCGARSGWNPSDNSLVTALTISWPGFKPQCGSFLKIVAPNGHFCVVRVWDSCAGCSGKWTDLTIRGFKALYPLHVGKMSGIKVYPVGQPFPKWTKQIQRIYGPQHQ